MFLQACLQDLHHPPMPLLRRMVLASFLALCFFPLPLRADLLGVHLGFNAGYFGPLGDDSAPSSSRGSLAGPSFAKRRGGLMAGLHSEFSLGDPRLFLYFGLDYVQKGLTIQNGGNSQDALLRFGINGRPQTDYRFQLEYLEIPFNVKIRFYEYPKSRAYLLLGMAPSFLIGQQLVTEDDAASLGSLNSIDLGFNFGIGVEVLAMQSSSFYFELKYTHGAIELSPGSYGNRSLQLVLGMNFGDHEPHYLPKPLFDLYPPDPDS